MHHRSSVPPHIALHARQLRSHLTDTEQLLWAGLRGGRLGLCFRRTADARRDRKLARLGYRVLRIDAELVRRAPEEALALIRRALAP